MIRPEDIHRKAVNLYPAWQIAWLNGESFFPRVIPCAKRPETDLNAAIESVQRLRAGSKEQLGFGYAVEWKERNSRRYGRNLFPERILFQTAEDFLRLIGKQREFSAFVAAVERIRRRFPELGPWIRSHRQELVSATSDIEGLLAVVDYFVVNPRPACFARELPAPVDTKFIERNQRILRSWLDIVLPSHTIRADEEHFDRRFGLQYVEPLILVRFLDAALHQQSCLPWQEFAVPLHTLAEHPIQCERALVVENKVNLFTLPPIAGAIALGGLGNAVTDLRYLTWLADKELWYWGDIDVEGFEILSRLRAIFPHATSIMMDEETILAWRESIGRSGSGRAPAPPPGLKPAEMLAFGVCTSENLRIEQERIRQQYVLQRLTSLNLACQSNFAERASAHLHSHAASPFHG